MRRDVSAKSDKKIRTPKTKRRIPTSTEAKFPVNTDDNVRHEVRVSSERLLGDSEGLFVFAARGYVPHENRLIAGCTDNQISIVIGGGNGSYPTSVTSKFSSCYKMFRHV